MTFWRAMRDRAPRQSVTVVIIGRNSGVRPTASATAKSSDSERRGAGGDADDEDEEHQEERPSA